MMEETRSRVSVLVLKNAGFTDESATLSFPSLSDAAVDVQDVRRFIDSIAVGGGSCTASSLSASASDSDAGTSSVPSSASASAASSAAASSPCYDALVVCGLPSAPVDFFSLARALFRVAKPTAFFLLLQQRNNNDAKENGESEAAAGLRKFRRLLAYSGFVAATVSDMPAMLQSIATDSSFLKSQQPQNYLLNWCGRKPAWDVGTFQVVGTGEATTPPNAGASSGDAELIDESALIEEKEVYIPLGKDRSSCASRPKACANCTCGRKEREEAEERDTRRKMLESGELRSSCGSCYLGDAFRCAGCPYRGLPAFKPGEKVSLVTEIPVAPGAQRTGETQTTTVSMNKVQIVDLADDL